MRGVRGERENGEGMRMEGERLAGRGRGRGKTVRGDKWGLVYIKLNFTVPAAICRRRCDVLCWAAVAVNTSMTREQQQQ